MDNPGILIDTSIILEYLRKKEKERTVLFQLSQTYNEIFVSSVSVFEVFVGINSKNRHIIEKLFEGFITVSFNEEVAKIASQQYQQLKSQNKLLEIKDLFIGATALAHHLPLATLNRAHFERIVNLKIV